jgi:hypothetical protein
VLEVRKEEAARVLLLHLIANRVWSFLPSFLWWCRKDGQVCDLNSSMECMLGWMHHSLLMTNGCEIRAFGLRFQIVKLQWTQSKLNKLWIVFFFFGGQVFSLCIQKGNPMWIALRGVFFFFWAKITQKSPYFEEKKS